VKEISYDTTLRKNQRIKKPRAIFSLKREEEYFRECCSYKFFELHERSMHKNPLKEYLDWRVIVKVLTIALGVELSNMYHQCISN